MLRIITSFQGPSAVEYFTKSLKREGYYLNDEVKTIWYGGTARHLGIEGKEVEAAVFSDLVNNIHPITKQRLTVRNAARRKAGFDLSFSAPKSLSIAYSLTKDDAILKAHQKGCIAAMIAIEEAMQTQANEANKRIYQRTGNLIYAPFDHFTSRPVKHMINGKPHFISDPQLHTHCYVANVTWNETKNRFQALEIGNIHRLAPYYEAIYHSVVSAELQKAGYATRQTKNAYEIEGVSRVLIRTFSNRSKEIDEAALEKGIAHNSKAKSQLGASTRHAKGLSVSEAQLYDIWKDRLSDAEFSDLLSLKGRPSPPSKEPELTADQAVDRALAHYAERSSAFQEKRVLATALSYGYGSFLPEEAEAALKRRDDILYSERDTISIITTKALVKAEDRMLDLATSGKGRVPALHPNYEIKQDILSAEQQKAVQTLLHSRSQVSILRGSAGTGKTTLTRELQMAASEQGRVLLATALSTQATEVLRKEGFEAETIASLLHKTELQERLHNQALLVDEASLCGIETMNKLLELSQAQSCRLYLAGDIAQHNPPGQYGDALRILQNKADLPTAEVRTIIRQKPAEYKKAITALSQGETASGYQQLDRMGAIAEIPEHDQRMDQLAEDYLSSLEQKRSALIVTPTHAERRQINDTVRQKMAERGALKGKAHTVKTLEPLHLTEAEKKHHGTYEDDLVVRFIKNQPGGFKAGQHYTILPGEEASSIQVLHEPSAKTYPLPLEVSEQFQLYRKRELDLQQGDLIRLTNNGWTKEIDGRKSKITNGTYHTIKSLTKDAIKLEGGKVIGKDYLHLTHGYAETSHSSQSKTCRDVYISVGDMSYGGASKEQLYVSASRGTHSVKIYTPDKGEFLKAVTKTEERITAREIADEYEQAELMRLQRLRYQFQNKSIHHLRTRHHGQTHQPYRGRGPEQDLPKG